MKAILFPAIAGALVAMSGAALAETAVSAVTDLNVRAGPGPQYPVIGVLAAGQSATLQGCIANSKWCTIAEAIGGSPEAHWPRRWCTICCLQCSLGALPSSTAAHTPITGY